jgi:class 3 adenylate cyclase
VSERADESQARLIQVIETPEVKYARTRDGAYVAYEIFGSGPIDVVLSKSLFPVDLMWDLPQLADFLSALGQLARVIAYDLRGWGASDPLPTTDPDAALESQAADLLTVLDAAGADRATLLSFGGTIEVVIAATHPQRVRSLILTNLRSSYPEMRDIDAERRKSIAVWLASSRGLKYYNPRVAHDPIVRRWWGKAHRLSSGPEQVARTIELAAEMDVSSLLEQIHMPTLVFHRQDNPAFDIETSRKTAARIPNSRFVELSGSESELFLGDTSQVLEEITRFLREPDVMSDRDDRRLATVLFTDIVASTEQLATKGDHAWRTILDDHDRTIDDIVATYRGQVHKRLGDGILATFDGPARAVRCAVAIRDALVDHGVIVRAGLHTGEVELRSDDLTGLAVHIGARVAALAEGGEVLVSSTVKDLVGGSGITFEDRGEHELKGVPGRWRLYAVTC